ncbi:MAG: GNAT family N-acetyltransferase, partial [Candidatus Pacearchaeota archaeon]
KAMIKMKDFYKRFDLFSIELGGIIVGFIVINPNFMYPGEVAFGEEFAIKSKFQRKGIGTEVLKRIFKIYREKGYKRFMGIAELKSNAFKLYKKLDILPSKKDILIEKELK